MNGMESVGFYTAGLKIYTLVFGVIGTLTTTLLPRFSNLVSSNSSNKDLNSLAQKAYCFIIGTTMPMCVGLFMISPYAVILFCGNSFQPSVIVSQITAPMLIVVGLSNLLGMQFLYSMGHIRILIKAALLSSFVDIVVLLCLIELSQIGAVISLLCAECSALSYEIIKGKSFFPIEFQDRSVIYYLVASSFMGIILGILTLLPLSDLVMTLTMCFVGMTSYVGTLLLLGESLSIEMMKRLHSMAVCYVKKCFTSK
jgi:O-antigen/teichoic acid export membrane protein